MLAPGAPVGLTFRDPALRERAARWVVEQPWCGLLFSPGANEVEGEVSGSFALSLAGIDNARTDDAWTDCGRPGTHN